MSLRHIERCMGTVFSITVRTPDIKPGAIAQVLDWLHWVDATFSTYRPDSEISRLNRGELSLEQVCAEVRGVLATASRLRADTDGYFDAELDATLDPSGLVKGWAIERASDLLYAAGSRNHCINGGGDVQCVLESAADAEQTPWRIGIADPQDRSQLATVITGTTIAVATSGVSERGDHIRDPHTGRPAGHLASLTLSGPRLAVIDAYATAAFAMGERARDWLAARPDIRSFAITTEGQRWRTGQWPFTQFDTRPAAPVLRPISAEAQDFSPPAAGTPRARL